MDHVLSRRHVKHTLDRGFTLIELLVVVLIIGILAGIAIPVFLNQKAKAQEATVRADLPNIAKTVESLLAGGATGSVSRDATLNAVTVGTASQAVQSSNDVLWDIAGTPQAYCAVGWSSAAGKYTKDAPLIYDSTKGGLAPGADCTGIPSLPAGFTTGGSGGGGVTPPTGPAIVLTYDTTLPSCADTTIILPLQGVAAGTTVNWGDGSATEPLTSSMSHTFTSPGAHDVTVLGTFTTISSLASASDARCIKSVPTWTGTGTTSASSAFNQAINLTFVTTPPATITNMASMFASAASFNGDISGWDTGAVTNMSSMFSNAAAFNQPIGNWDTKNVTNMSMMFTNAAAFNQPINWNTAKVTNMQNMFGGATAFNKPIRSGFVTATTTNVASMFNGAASFNQPLTGWDTSKVTSLSGMFTGAKSFNQDVGYWDTSAVTSVSGTFNGAIAFNRDVSGWDTSKVRYMDSTFLGAVSAVENLSGWSTAAVANPAIDKLTFNSGAPGVVAPLAFQ